jgi:hypothetical protein
MTIKIKDQSCVIFAILLSVRNACFVDGLTQSAWQHPATTNDFLEMNCQDCQVADSNILLPSWQVPKNSVGKLLSEQIIHITSVGL